MMLPAALLLLLLNTVHATEPACSTGGSAVEPADAVRAISACERARTRFGELFGVVAPRAHVQLHDAPGYEVGLVQDAGVVFWPNSGALPAGAPAPWVARQWEEVLVHELMHALTMAHFFAGGDAVDEAGYGTPLPDWFEEGIAIWGEPEQSRRGRLQQARSLPEPRLELAAILSGRHPVAGNPTLMASEPGAAVPRDEALRAFYPQSIAVVAYVHERGGAPAVRELGRRLLADPDDAHALAGLPGLPAEMAGVAAEWRAWLARQ
jgi:hypothetical protein